MPDPFNLVDPNVIDWINSRSLLLAKAINETTLKALREILRDGYTKGESIATLTKQISDYFPESEKYRAERIARSEIIAANNAGTLDRYKDEGVGKKEWMAALDERTRDTHRDADGQVVGINDYFVVGNDRMQAPGQGSDPSENINCRCTILARLD